MVNLAYEVETLGNRGTFNKVVNYAKTVIEVIGELESNYNIADVLNDLIEQERFENNYVSPIVCSLLLDKYNYSAESHNLEGRRSGDRLFSSRAGRDYHQSQETG
jgi:hypothetical protein